VTPHLEYAAACYCGVASLSDSQGDDVRRYAIVFQCAARPGARLRSGHSGAAHLQTTLIRGDGDWTREGPSALRRIFRDRYGGADSEWTFAERDVRPYAILLMNADYFEELYGVWCGGGWLTDTEEAPWVWVEKDAQHGSRLAAAVEQQKQQPVSAGRAASSAAGAGGVPTANPNPSPNPSPNLNPNAAGAGGVPTAPLYTMGFDAELVTQALAACGGDVAEALERLLSVSQAGGAPAAGTTAPPAVTIAPAAVHATPAAVHATPHAAATAVGAVHVAPMPPLHQGPRTSAAAALHVPPTSAAAAPSISAASDASPSISIASYIDANDAFMSIASPPSQQQHPRGSSAADSRASDALREAATAVRADRTAWTRFSAGAAEGPDDAAATDAILLDAKLARLAEMGFTRDQAYEALEASGGDLRAAAARLAS